MQTTLGHLVFGIDPKNQPFYRDLLDFLGWKTLFQVEEMFAASGSNGISLWFGNATSDTANDYDSSGLNHLAFHTATQADVDEAVAYLSERDIAPLFDTPRHRPDFSEDEHSTYYQVMFETPDRILVEIVYIGPKS